MAVTSEGAGLVPGRRRSAEWIATAAMAAVLMVLYATLLLDDHTFTWLIDEEHPIELAGALALLATGVLCLVTWRRARHWSRLPRVCLLAFSVLFLFGAGEEVSWGQRIIGLETPQDISRVNAQDELNVHNLEFFSGLLDADRLFQIFWLVFGVVVPLAALHLGARRRLARLVPILPAPLAVAFLLNQALTKGFDALLAARPELYNSTVFPVGHSIFEIKETGVALIFACGFWLLLHSVDADRATAEQAAPGSPSRRAHDLIRRSRTPGLCPARSAAPPARPCCRP